MHLEIPEIFLQFSRNNDILKFSERTMDLKQVVKLYLQSEKLSPMQQKKVNKPVTLTLFFTWN